MKLSEAVKPISYVKTHAAEVIKEVADTHQPVIITQNGEAKAVLQSIADYEQMQESIALLKIIAMGKASVAKGKTKPVRKAFRDVRKKAASARKEA